MHFPRMGRALPDLVLPLWLLSQSAVPEIGGHGVFSLGGEGESRDRSRSSNPCTAVWDRNISQMVNLSTCRSEENLIHKLRQQREQTWHENRDFKLCLPREQSESLAKAAFKSLKSNLGNHCHLNSHCRCVFPSEIAGRLTSALNMPRLNMWTWLPCCVVARISDFKVNSKQVKLEGLFRFSFGVGLPAWIKPFDLRIK